MTIGPEPMIRMVWMSVRLGIGAILSFSRCIIDVRQRSSRAAKSSNFCRSSSSNREIGSHYRVVLNP